MTTKCPFQKLTQKAFPQQFEHMIYTINNDIQQNKAHELHILLSYYTTQMTALSTDPLISDQLSQNSNQLDLIPEYQIMQNLSQYFLSPTSKSMPYLYYFNKHMDWPVYTLAYLYNFIRYNHNTKIVGKYFAKMLGVEQRDTSLHSEENRYPNKSIIKEVIAKIINFDNSDNQNCATNRKILISRYISIPSAIAEQLSKNKINCAIIEQAIIEQISLSLQELHEQQKIYIINKIIMLGHSIILLRVLIQDMKLLDDVLKKYQMIVKKDSFVIALIKLVLQKVGNQQSVKQNVTSSKMLQQIIKQHHQNQNHQTIIRVLNQSFLIPSYALIIYNMILKVNAKLTKSLLQDLSIWWTQGNDYYLIYDTVKFKANLLALILMAMNKDDIILYSSIISLGIQRRLLVATERRKQVVNLIWAVLASKMEFKLNGHFSLDLLKNDEVKTQNNDTNINKEEKQQTMNNTKQHSQKGKQTQVDIDEQNKQSSQKKQIDQKSIQYDEQFITVKPPLNIYDCILGLRNSSRKQITLKMLPKIIRNNPQDLVLTWGDLTLQLMYNLSRETEPSVIALFVERPLPFIQSVGQIFFNKDHSLNDKIILIDALEQGIQELSDKPLPTQGYTHNQQFYFKKVSSKYYNDKQKIQQKPEKKADDTNRTRRWGHTRIAYQQKNNKNKSETVSLNIIKSDPYINRLYQIANQLFFRVISKLALLPIFPNQPMFTTSLLKLLAVLSFNLKNHIQKYKILIQIVDICLLVISFIEGENKDNKKNDIKENTLKKWKDTHLAVLQTMNKVSLVIDQFIPPRMVELLQKCIAKLRSSPQYGINPIINMIQANVYTNSSGNKVQY